MKSDDHSISRYELRYWSEARQCESHQKPRYSSSIGRYLEISC